MPAYYALISHGRNPAYQPRSFLDELPQVRNLRAFHSKLPAGARFDLYTDYTRKVTGLSSLPVLRTLLEKAQARDGAVVVDSFLRVFSRCPLQHRPALMSELDDYGDHFWDVQFRTSFGELNPAPRHLLLINQGQVRFQVRTEMPNTEPTQRGREQTKAATKTSAKARALKADKKAERLIEIRAELTEGGKAPTLKEIADEANTRGLTTTRGNQWTASTVQRALKRLQM